MIFQIISFTAALIALGGVVYAFAFWRGKVERQLAQYDEANVLDRLMKFETKQDVLWVVFQEQVLTNRPDLAKRSSSFELTEEAEKALEDVRKYLTVAENPTSEQVLFEVPHKVGLGKLKKIAEKHGMTLGELLAIISVKLGIGTGEMEGTR